MHFLEEITIIATISVLVTLILGRLKLPVIAGLVLSGALVGPKAFSLAHDPEAIEVIAEVGVVILLFTIGIGVLTGSIASYIQTSGPRWVASSRCYCCGYHDNRPLGWMLPT